MYGTYYRRNSIEITKREVIASITIIAVLLIVGMMIAGRISDRISDNTLRYNKALKIEDSELFVYGMSTSVGDAFIYGDLKAVDTVTYPEIGGAYLSVTKVKEEYTRHTRTVDIEDEDGNVIGTKEEEYWTWDEVWRDSIYANRVNFCSVDFNYSQFNRQAENYIDTLNGGYHVRYKYYGAPTQYRGTAFATLRDNNFTVEGARFFANMTIGDTVKSLSSRAGLYFFWVFWVLLIVGAVYLFYSLENRWLE